MYHAQGAITQRHAQRSATLAPGEYRPRRTGRLYVTLTQTTALRGVFSIKSALWWAWSQLASRVSGCGRLRPKALLRAQVDQERCGGRARRGGGVGRLVEGAEGEANLIRCGCGKVPRPLATAQANFCVWGIHETFFRET